MHGRQRQHTPPIPTRRVAYMTPPPYRCLCTYVRVYIHGGLYSHWYVYAQTLHKSVRTEVCSPFCNGLMKQAVNLEVDCQQRCHADNQESAIVFVVWINGKASSDTWPSRMDMLSDLKTCASTWAVHTILKRSLDQIARGCCIERMVRSTLLQKCSSCPGTKLCGTDYVPGALHNISFHRFTAAGQVQSVGPDRDPRTFLDPILAMSTRKPMFARMPPS